MNVEKREWLRKNKNRRWKRKDGRGQQGKSTRKGKGW
jgi:hypothetical protein